MAGGYRVIKHLMVIALFASTFMVGWSLAAYLDDRWR